MAKMGRPRKTEWPECKVPGCTNLTRGGAHGFCRKHYRNFRVGLIDKEGAETGLRTRTHSAGGFCSVEGCLSSAEKKGMCELHYARSCRAAGRQGDPAAAKVCRLCNSPSMARGFCGTHYAQWQKGIIGAEGEALRPALRRRSVPAGAVCEIDGCDGAMKSRGFCNKHYMQLRAGIINAAGVQQRELGGRPARKGYRCTKQGYLKVKAPKGHPGADKDGYVLEHRLVMEKHLGRYLEPGEVVHHLDGVRDHNRIENLQLMCSRKKHPPFAERTGTVDDAMNVLERLVNKNMSGGEDMKKRLRRLVKRL